MVRSYNYQLLDEIKQNIVICQWGAQLFTSAGLRLWQITVDQRDTLKSRHSAITEFIIVYHSITKFVFIFRSLPDSSGKRSAIYFKRECDFKYA